MTKQSEEGGPASDGDPPVSERRRAEALRRSVLSVAHDLSNIVMMARERTELAHIVGFDTGDGPRDSLLGLLDVAGDLVSELREVGRGQAREHEPIDLVELVKSETAVLRRILPARHELRLFCLVDQAIVMASAHELRRVLRNLTTNAHDAMPSGGPIDITLSTAPEDGEVLLTFEDRGAGMSEDVLHLAFESEQSTKQGHEGLGLAVVRDIVLAHGGTIRVLPAATAGTRFVIVLPLREEKGS